MSRLLMSGFELGDATSEGFTLTGAGLTFATDQFRTGSRSMKIASAATTSYLQKSITGVLGRTYYARVYMRYSTTPTVNSMQIMKFVFGAADCSLNINTAGKLSIGSSAGGIGSSTDVVPTGVFHCIEFRLFVQTGSDAFEVRLNGETVILNNAFALSESALSLLRVGFDATPAANTDYWLDDFALNDDQGTDQNSWPGPGSIHYLRPASQVSVTASTWQKPGAAVTAMNTSVDNIPPVYGADSTNVAQAEDMVRDAANTANADLVLATDTYDSKVAAGDVITVAQGVALTGSSSATDTAGNFDVTSNPTFAAASDFAAFDNGVASATVTTWRRIETIFTYLPTVTRSSGAQLRMRKVTAITRVALVNMMALVVEATPRSDPPRIPHRHVNGLVLRGRR